MVRVRIVGLNRERHRVIGNGLLKFADLIVREGAVVVRLEVLRVEAKRVCVVLNG